MDEHTSKSIFSVASKYPAGDTRPLENFITEIFAWLLANNKDFAESVIQMIFRSSGPTSVSPLDDFKQSDVRWQTQVYIEGSDTNPHSYLDLVADCNNLIVIFEHKAGSPLDPEQLQRYTEISPNLWEQKQRHYVFITGSVVDQASLKRLQKNDAFPGPWHAITWDEVRNTALGFIKVKSSSDDGVGNGTLFVLEQFCQFIEEEGMGPRASVNATELPNLVEINTQAKRLSQFEDAITGILQDVCPSALSCSAQKVLGSPGAFQLQNKWGRIGWWIPDERQWTPGIFYGVLYDGRDHRVELNAVKLVVMLDFNIKDETTKSYATTEQYKKLVQAIRSAGMKPREESGNKWHPLHFWFDLKDDVLGAESDRDKQVAIVKEKVEAVLETLASENVFDTLEQLRALAPNNRRGSSA